MEMKPCLGEEKKKSGTRSRWARIMRTAAGNTALKIIDCVPAGTTALL